MAGLAVGALVLLSGCSSQPEILVSASGSRVLIGTESTAGMDAMADGQVVLVGDACLGLRTGQSAGPAGEVVLVFPPGTTITADDPLTVAFDGRSVAVGSAASIAGGEQREIDGFSELPPSCGGRPFWIVAPA